MKVELLDELDCPEDEIKKELEKGAEEGRYISEKEIGAVYYMLNR